MRRTTKTRELKKTQKKIVDYFIDKPYYVKSKLAASELKISPETMADNLKTLSDMNVLERKYKISEVSVYINSREDWQVYQVNNMPKGWKNGSC